MTLLWLMHAPVAVSVDGLRQDGRRQFELRKVVCRVGGGGLPGDGCSLFQSGNTHVVASVFGPHERPARVGGGEQCTVAVEVHVASFAGQDRKAALRRDRRALETSLLLQQLFERVIETDKFPRSEIRLCLTVLAADGGMRAACVNAATLALTHAPFLLS